MSLLGRGARLLPPVRAQHDSVLAIGIRKAGGDVRSFFALVMISYLPSGREGGREAGMRAGVFFSYGRAVAAMACAFSLRFGILACGEKNEKGEEVWRFSAIRSVLFRLSFSCHMMGYGSGRGTIRFRLLWWGRLFTIFFLQVCVVPLVKWGECGDTANCWCWAFATMDVEGDLVQCGVDGSKCDACSC